MSNNITKFLNSRNEVKLSAEKIELNLMKDLKDSLNAAESAKEKVFKNIPNLKAVVSLAEDARRGFSNAGVQAEKVATALKELGLPNDELVNRVLKVWSVSAKEMDSIASDFKNVANKY